MLDRKEGSKWSIMKPVAAIVMLVIALGCAAAVAGGMLTVPLFAVAGLVGILLIYLCLASPLIGFHMVAVISFFTAYPERMLRIKIPITTGIEVLILMLFIGLFSKRRQLKEVSSFYKTPASIAFLIYVVFIIVELFNPNMYSIAGWLFYFRRLIMFMMIYIAGYYLLDDYKKVRNFLKLWVLLAFLTCAYGCYQQWFGLLSFEMQYLIDNPHEYKLYFQGGVIRKFSFLSDPTTFGLMAGSSSCFMLVLLINQKRASKRWLMLFIFVVMVIGMTFSGTRTANIMLPAALCLYTLLTMTSRRTQITILAAALVGAFVMFGPIQNSTINRIRSTFDKKEESGAVRDLNRKYIQPYIYAHPIGGGVATSGVLGEKYNPGHPLAGFPPDSGYLQAAIELGWIGYAITILVYFLILYQCVHYYFITRHAEYRILIAGLGCGVFSLIVTQYSQVSIGQLPTALFFYTAIAIIARLKDLSAKKEIETQTI